MFSTKIPQFRMRMLLMCVGIFFMGFFLSFLVELRLGTDPFNTCFLGVAKTTGMSHGTTVLLVHSLLFILTLWRGRKYISFGTIGNMVFVGYISDFFRWIWGLILPDGFFMIHAVRWGLVFPILALFVISAGVYMAADVGMSPYDALPHIIIEAFPRLPFTAVRLSIDMLCVIGGFLTGADIGIVTALMAFCIAPILAFVQKKTEAWLKKKEESKG